MQAWAASIIAEYGLLVVLMLAAGLFAGFVAGMFGIGGGFVVVPVLALVLSVLPNGAGSAHIMHVAIGTSLATIFFTSLRSVQAHARRGAVDWGILKDWAPWVAAGVAAGVVMTGAMDATALKLAFGIGVLLMGLHFLFPVLAAHAAPEERMPSGPVRAVFGSTLGAACSMLGIGGGTPAVLIMTLHGVNIHRAVATAAGFGAVIAIPGALGSVLMGLRADDLPAGSLGFVNVIALVAVVATSMITAPMGAAAAHRLDPVKLKKVFGLYLLATSVLMLHDSLPKLGLTL